MLSVSNEQTEWGATGKGHTCEQRSEYTAAKGGKPGEEMHEGNME